ncbi:MAG: YfiR family protein [Verrucomicrobia bacterium]|nr:YfiR family protein [Verrucomicrobiota bacterium]
MSQLSIQISARVKAAIVSALLCLPICVKAASGDAPVSFSPQEEYIAKFVWACPFYTKWPSNVSPKPEDAFIIGILRNDPYARILQSYADNYPIKLQGEKQHKVILKTFETLENASGCHLFLLGFAVAEHKKKMQALEKSSTLSISVDVGGGMLELLPDPRSQVSKVYTRHLNQSPIQKANLEIGTPLKKVCRIVP